MPKQINEYTFGAELVRRFGLKGRYQPVLDEVIVPVVNVGAAVPPQGRPAIGGHTVTASGAGNQNVIYFGNPITSNVVVTLVDWWSVSGAPLTDFIVIQQQTGNLTLASGTKLWRDSSIAGDPLAGWAGAAPAAAVLGNPKYHLDTDSIVWTTGWDLYPGDYFIFRQNAQNTTLGINARWIETPVTATRPAPR